MGKYIFLLVILLILSLDFYDIISIEVIVMEGKIFRLTKIEGEYAYLSPLDGCEDIFIALALLPLGADIGSLLICEGFSFSFLN